MRVLVGCEYSGRVRNAYRLGPSEDRWKERSRTFAGVAKAMAEQWGRY